MQHLGLSGIHPLRSVKAPQDYLMITVGVTKTGPNGAAVQNELKSIIDAALVQAKSKTNNDLKVKTGVFRVAPVYDRDQRLTQWNGVASLIVEGKDMVGVASLAANLKGLSVTGTSMGLSDAARTQYETQAQQLAIDDFRTKAKRTAEQFGFSNYTIDNVMVNASNEFIAPIRAMEMDSVAMKSMASPIPVEAGETSVSVHVSGTVKMTK